MESHLVFKLLTSLPLRTKLKVRITYLSLVYLGSCGSLALSNLTIEGICNLLDDYQTHAWCVHVTYTLHIRALMRG